jgi:hypothetical protein
MRNARGRIVVVHLPARFGHQAAQLCRKLVH